MAPLSCDLMSQPRPRARASTPPPIDVQAPGRADAAWVLLAIAGALIAFWGALPYFFAQDDFSGLARARGLLPPVAFPWRWVSGQLYFDVMRVLAGLNPLPYRIVTLATHALCVALVYRLCRRFSPPPAAAVGAIFFGTHPALFTAIYSISGIGEILATVFALASLLIVTRRGAGAWFALPLFAASLLSKESTLLLPLVALLPMLAPEAAPAGDGRPAARTLKAPVWALLALSIAYLAAFFGRDVFGIRASLPDSAAYALNFDRTLLDNLATYLGWTIKIALPWVHSFTDAIDPQAWGAGLLVAAVCATGFALRPLRRRGWGVGAAWFTLALLPVLPLAHHTYHYYLYAPLAGAAVLVAAVTAVLTGLPGRWASARLRGMGPAVTAVLLATNGALLVHKIETVPFVDPELRAEATVDRALIAAHAIDDLHTGSPPAATHVWFWSPASIARQQAEGKDPALESYWESNVRTALADGLAARLFEPQLAQTRFVRAFEPAGDSVRYAVYLPNGHLRLGTPAELDSMLRRMHPGAP